MSFSSRRRNYLLTPHRRDGLIEWMKSMLQHSFVLDALETTGADTFSHFEVLIEEHRLIALKNVEGGGQQQQQQPSRLQQLVPTIGTFHTPLPLRRAFKVYNDKHRLTKRKHIQISFNEIRHILNLAQIMAMCKEEDEKEEKGKKIEQEMEGILEHGGNEPLPSPSSSSFSSPPPTAPLSTVISSTATTQLNGPRLISFDGDQTLYSDGSNFEGNPELANYMYLLLRHGVFVAVVTAAGYEYQSEKYEFRLSGLLKYFCKRGLTSAECERFYLFGGECNYLLQLGPDYRLHPVREQGPGGWCTATQYLPDAPANWAEDQVTALLDVAQLNAQKAVEELNLRRARVIRKRRSIGLVPISTSAEIPRESLDETVLRVHEQLARMNDGKGPGIPYCAFNGGTDCWVDVGNKRVGVHILQSYLGVAQDETLHIGDQFVSIGNDYAARAVSPCIWIINPQETTYILKSILRLAKVPHALPPAVDEKKNTPLPAVETVLDRKMRLSESAISSFADSGIFNDDNNITDNNINETQSGDDDDGAAAAAAAVIDFEELQRRTQAVKAMDVYTGELISK